MTTKTRNNMRNNIKNSIKNSIRGSVSLCLLLLSSCVGVGADLTIRADGSGLIELEYRISRFAESLGKLDGNEGWPLVPVGRADFERTVSRVEGLKLRSFSSKDDGKDLVNTVKLEFADAKALLRFLDASGQRASLLEENGQRRLTLILSSGAERLSPEVLDVFTLVSAGYSLRLSFTVPGKGSLSLSDAEGNPVKDAPGTLVSSGKKVSFTCPLGDLLASRGGLRLSLLF
jgi:hypothetical protein